MITTSGPWFTDEHGRTLILRGVNLGGSSKVPVRPDGATYLREGFFDHRDVSFVGRPFPLEEADEHFAPPARLGLRPSCACWSPGRRSSTPGPGQLRRGVPRLRARDRREGRPSTASTCSSIRTRTCGAASPAATARRAGRSRRSASTSTQLCTRPARPSSTQLHGDPFPRMIWPTNDDQARHRHHVHAVLRRQRLRARDPHRRRAGAGVPPAPLHRRHVPAGRAAARPAQRGGLRHAERAGAAATSAGRSARARAASCSWARARRPFAGDAARRRPSRRRSTCGRRGSPGSKRTRHARR